MRLEQRIPPVILVIISSLSMILTNEIYNELNISYSYNVPLFILFAFSGAIFALIGVVAFKKHQTTVNPIKSSEVSSLVNTGIYRYSRNPMYVGMLAILMGLLFYLSNPINIVFIVLFVCYLNKYQISPEEASLKHLFGNEYIAYKKTVRRWL